MVRALVITEKASQAQHVREAVGSRYGQVLPARGHLLDLVEPDQVKPEWKVWTADLLYPGGLYPKQVSRERGARELYNAIAAAAKGADQIIIATDCDREGQLIGQEIAEAIGFKGTVLRAMFNAEDPRSLQEAFSKLVSNDQYKGLYTSAVARQQCDQVYNLSLTRTATVTLRKPGGKGAVGVGRVKTPTLAIVARRELEILNFKPRAYFEVEALGAVASGPLTLRCTTMPGTATPSAVDSEERHDPDTGDEEAASLTDAGAEDPLHGRIVDRALAEGLAKAAAGAKAPLAVKVRAGSQAPPKLHDLTSLQTACSAKFGWSGDKTLQLAQTLYSEHKILTYPRAEARYLSENQIAEAPTLAAELTTLPGFQLAAAAAKSPIIRKGRDGHFSNKQLEGLSHHAIVPNFNMSADFRRIVPTLAPDEAKLFDLVARSYLAALMPDFTFRQTDASLAVPYRGAPWLFRASGRQPLLPGWRALYSAADKLDQAPDLPVMKDGETVTLKSASAVGKETKPPARYTEGTLLKAMQEAWRFVSDPKLKQRLREAKGIGTPATRASVIKGLFDQAQLERKGKQVRPTAGGLALYELLEQITPELNDPGRTAIWELLFDQVEKGKVTVEQAVKSLADQAKALIDKIAASGSQLAIGKSSAPSEKMVAYAKQLAERKGLALPRTTLQDGALLKQFLDQHAPKTAPGETRAPTEAMLAFAQKLAADAGTALTAAQLADGKLLSTFIEEHKTTQPPSEKALRFAQRLADEQSLELPPEVATNSQACSRFIETHMPKKGRPTRRAAPDGPS
jgi:DNA topoisomerase-3